MMLIDLKYEIGDIVYLITDTEQTARIVVYIKLCPHNSIIYGIATNERISEHYFFELSIDPKLHL